MTMNSPLRTALGAAFIRAHHTKFGVSPLIFRDQLAHELLTADEESGYYGFYIRRVHEEVSLAARRRLFPPAANEVDAFMRNSPIATEVLTRQRFAEDSLSIAVQSGATQYIILGAGMDTYALRNPDSKLAIFEVDRSSVQNSKIERVCRTGLPLPESLTFVATQFEKGTLARDLCLAGFQPERRAYFSWLGVTPYLTLGSIQSVVASISDLCTSGSELVFDYTSPDALVPGVGTESTILLAGRLHNVGESLQLSLRTEELGDLVVGTKFQIAEHLGPDEIHSMYTEMRPDGYLRPDFVYFVRLVVP